MPDNEQPLSLVFLRPSGLEVGACDGDLAGGSPEQEGDVE